MPFCMRKHSSVCIRNLQLLSSSWMGHRKSSAALLIVCERIFADHSSADQVQTKDDELLKRVFNKPLENKFMTFVLATITPITKPVVKPKPNPNPNPKPDPYTTLIQKPNDNPCFHSLSPEISSGPGAIVAGANVRSPRKHFQAIICQKQFW